MVTITGTDIPVKKKFYCPRCDRPFPQGKKTLTELSGELLRHVSDAHPDYDPEWNDTHPHNAPPIGIEN